MSGELEKYFAMLHLSSWLLGVSVLFGKGSSSILRSSLESLELHFLFHFLLGNRHFENFVRSILKLHNNFSLFLVMRRLIYFRERSSYRFSHHHETHASIFYLDGMLLEIFIYHQLTSKWYNPIVKEDLRICREK